MKLQLVEKFFHFCRGSLILHPKKKTHCKYVQGLLATYFVFLKWFMHISLLSHEEDLYRGTITTFIDVSYLLVGKVKCESNSQRSAIILQLKNFLNQFRSDKMRTNFVRRKPRLLSIVQFYCWKSLITFSFHKDFFKKL